MEAVALYYQYVLGDDPCQICIHIRIWVAAFTLLAVLMCLLPRHKIINLVAQGLALVCMIGLFERSKYLFDMENGRGDGSCEFFLGFPDWIALDQWVPFLFEVRNLCTFSPELMWGVTMTEGLLGASVALILVSGGALLVNLVGTIRNTEKTEAL